MVKQVEQFKLDGESRYFSQLKNQTNSLTVKAEVYSGKLINAILPTRQTFWSRTGELGKAQPDNYNGQKAGRQYNQHHFLIYYFAPTWRSLMFTFAQAGQCERQEWSDCRGATRVL